MKTISRGIALLAITLTIAFESFAQEPTWAWQLDADNSICILRLMETDNAGNTYVVGTFSEFDLTIQDQILPMPEGETSAGFMLKVDPNGNLLWMKSFPNAIIASDLAITSDGRLFFAFTITPETPFSPIDIDGVSFTMYLGINGYVYEFDEDGTAIAGHEFQDGSNFFTLSGLNTMDVDGEDNLIMSGVYSSSMIINGFQFTHPEGLFTAGFLLKMDADGTVAWGEDFTPTDDRGGFVFMDVAPDNSIFGYGVWGGDSLYIGDNFFIESQEEGELPGGRYSAKFSAEGNLIWATYIGSEPGAGGSFSGITATSDNGAALFFNGGEVSIDGVPLNGTDGYLAKQNFEGGISSVQDIASQGSLAKIKATEDDGFLIQSNFDSETFTIPGTTITSAEAGFRDGVLFKLNSELETEWFVQVGGEDNDQIVDAKPFDGGYIVVGDYQSSELDFNGETITNDFTPDADIFIARLDIPLSVSNRDKVELVNVFPNPTSDFIQVDLRETDARIDQISIFDVTGKMVLQENNTAGQFIQIEVSNLPQGQYTALLQSGMITYVSKFIKQN